MNCMKSIKWIALSGSYVSETMQNQTESETEPEYTDEQIKSVINSLWEFIESDPVLNYNITQIYSQQLENPYTSDHAGLTLYMDGEAGSGSTKGGIIQRIITSDVPVRLKNTCEGHGHLSFEIDA